MASWPAPVKTTLALHKGAHVRFLLAVVLVMSGTPPAMSASFNCARAESNVEKLICANPTLSRLDERMGILYRQVVQSLGEKEKLKKTQSAWLREVRDSCENPVCLEREYEKRNLELSNELENSKNFEVAKYIGHYRKAHTTSCFQPGPNGEDVLSSCDTEDNLYIEETSDGSYEISVEVIGANFHQCATSGPAIRKGTILEHRYEECLLILQLDPDGVLLVDQNRRNCFCGMRASLRNVKFFLTEKDSQ